MKNKIGELIKKISLIYVFLYVFNTALIFKLIGSQISMILFITSFIFLLLLSLSRKLKKYQLITLLLCLIVFFIQITNNHYIFEGREADVIKYSLCLMLPFIIVTNKDLVNMFPKLMTVFGLEHVFLTMVIQLFRNLYINNIMPWLYNGNYTYANLQFNLGYNPGITSNYSTNAVYISIAIISVFANYLNKKRKSDLILLIVSFVALLYTAKRAHLIFSIITCIFMYIFVNRKKVSKKIIKILIYVIIIGMAFVITSTFVPAITKVIDRFEEGYQSGDMLNGRTELYSLALDLWNDNKLLGNGWGSYSYYYKIRYHWNNIEYLDTHNVYLQLLCEVGLVGLAFFLILAFKILEKNIKVNKIYMKQSQASIFTLGYVLFFLMYCFSGNPLYDTFCYSIFFASVGITRYLYYERVVGEKENE